MALRGWLQDRKKEGILKRSVDHMQKVLETIHELERGFGFFTIEKKADLAYKVFQRVLDLEHEADIMRRDLLIEINQSDMGSKMREDLMGITKRIDNVADEADHAARRIMAIDPSHIIALGNETLVCVNSLVQKSVEITKKLFNLIKNLPTMTNEELFLATEQIQKSEHECDKIHSNIYQYVNKMKNLNLNPFVAIQISKYIDHIESISNKVEDVADYIELLKTIEV